MNRNTRNLCTSLAICIISTVSYACHTTQEIGAKLQAHNCPWTADEIENHIHDLKSLWRCWYGYVPPLDNIEIVCADTVTVGDMHVGGYSTSNKVRVESMPLKQSAVWHELMHIILQRTTGDPDASHSSPLPWTLVEMRHRDVDFCPDVEREPGLERLASD